MAGAAGRALGAAADAGAAAMPSGQATAASMVKTSTSFLCMDPSPVPDFVSSECRDRRPLLAGPQAVEQIIDHIFCPGKFRAFAASNNP